MKKLTVLLLLLSMLLCAFASCQQPDVPPADSFDTNDTDDSTWDSSIQTYWDACVTKGDTKPECIISTNWDIDFPAVSTPRFYIYYTTDEKEAIIQKMGEIAEFLPNPSSFTPTTVSTSSYPLSSFLSSFSPSSSDAVTEKKSDMISWETDGKRILITVIRDESEEIVKYSFSIRLYVGENAYGNKFTLTEEQYTEIITKVGTVLAEFQDEHIYGE